MSEAYILCLQCRGTFTEEEVSKGYACPRCGNTGTPADVRKRATVTLTEHEWRILCIWASNWAKQCDQKTPDKASSNTTIEAMVREIHRQAPNLGPLTMGEELQDVADNFGRVEYHHGGETEVFDKKRGN